MHNASRNQSINNFDQSLSNLRNQVYLQLQAHQQKTLLITSVAAPQSEVSIATALAESFSENGASVALVTFGDDLSHLSGLQSDTKLAIERTNVPDSHAVIQQLTPTLAICGYGELSAALPEAITTGEFQQTLDHLGEHADIIIICGASVLDDPNTVLLAEQADFTALAVSYQQTHKKTLTRALEVLHTNQSSEIFAIYTDVPSKRSAYNF